jgi:hypothetical protein
MMHLIEDITTHIVIVIITTDSIITIDTVWPIITEEEDSIDRVVVFMIEMVA